jgi:phosphate transport system substrate-binding protein
MRFSFDVRTAACASRVTAVILGALVLGACDKSEPPPADKPQASAATQTVAAQTKTGTVQISGSSALQPLVNAAKEQFEQQHKGVSVEVSAGGSKKGLADVAGGAVQIGDSDIFAPDDLKPQLVDHRVAVVNRAPGSGTRAVFGNIVLGGDKFVESQTEDNSGALVAKLKQTKGAISYLALSFVDPELKVIGLKVDAATVDPSTATITAGTYPIWSYEHMYTKGQPTGVVKDFLDYMLSPSFQEHVLPSVKGFISVTQMKVSREKD